MAVSWLAARVAPCGPLVEPIPLGNLAAVVEVLSAELLKAKGGDPPEEQQPPT